MKLCHLRSVLTCLALWSGADAGACVRHYAPDMYEASQYKTALLAEVTGVHVVEYEEYRLAVLHSPPAKDEAAILEGPILPTSSTPYFELRAVTLETFRGRPRRVARYELGGCGVPRPDLYEKVLLFITRQRDVVVVPESDAEFTRWRTFAESLRSRQL
jgi:hypothetical protein